MKLYAEKLNEVHFIVEAKRSCEFHLCAQK